MVLITKQAKPQNTYSCARTFGILTYEKSLRISYVYERVVCTCERVLHVQHVRLHRRCIHARTHNRIAFFRVDFFKVDRELLSSSNSEEEVRRIE